MRVSTKAIGRVRSNFSVPHMWAAARFSREVAEIERDNAGQTFGPFFEEILSFSTGCVLTCAASLESYANELFTDHEENFPDVSTKLMKKLWELFEQKPLLDKFEYALLLWNIPVMDKSRRPYQDVAALISLRNALIHFKPEWDDEQTVHSRVSSRLKGKFTPSPFVNEVEPLFPKRWATHGCTKWAIESSLMFIYEFEETGGLEHRFEKHKERLATG